MDEWVPGPRSWRPAGGRLRLPGDARLVLDEAAAQAVRPLEPELRAATGLPLPRVCAGPADSRDPALRVPAGDIVVRHDPALDLPAGGYTLAIGERAGVQVAGVDPAGAFYGLQSVLKLCRAAAGQGLPRGAGRDWPGVPVRGAMLDLGRRYWSPAYLRRFIRRLAWLGGNRLQLHLTDWNAFRVRLADPRFAGLAAQLPADRSYPAGVLRELIAYGRELHVAVVPEIDLPAHATAITRHHPGLRFTGPGAEAANDGVAFTKRPTDGWTIDITRPENRAWVRELLAAFATELDAPTVHIGGDEWQEDAELARCADLVAYAQSLNPAYRPTDALVCFVNELVALLRDRGREVELWSWWEVAGGGECRAWIDRDARITAWPREADGIKFFTDHGYRVVASPMATHYVTPPAPGGGPGRVPDVRWLYERWEPARDSGVEGYQLGVWADHAMGESDAYFDGHLRRPLAVVLDRLWGGPRRAGVEEFLDAIEALPEPAPGAAPDRGQPGADRRPVDPSGPGGVGPSSAGAAGPPAEDRG
ncbi:beta-N-acetylhexosaminidase [Rugosimonospora acidiphila]